MSCLYTENLTDRKFGAQNKRPYGPPETMTCFKNYKRDGQKIKPTSGDALCSHRPKYAQKRTSHLQMWGLAVCPFAQA